MQINETNELGDILSRSGDGKGEGRSEQCQLWTIEESEEMKRYWVLITVIPLLSILSGCLDPYEGEREQLAEEIEQYEDIAQLRCNIFSEENILEFTLYSDDFNWNDYKICVWNSSGEGDGGDSQVILEIQEDHRETQTISYGKETWHPYTGEEYVIQIAHIGWNKEMRKMYVIAT
ncbi:MAG: hypothetical protein ACMUHY_04695 [Thermoplasmatota archaeon]